MDDIWHHAHLILGRAALRRGDLAVAGVNLLDAGRISGGGTLSSFGPNMSLAKELLEKGDNTVVLQYFELCRGFWTSGARSLNAWVGAVHNGSVPNFGANLAY